MNSLVTPRSPRLSLSELKAAAAEMRAMNVVSIFAAGSGHPGGTLSVMDIAAALYLNVLNHDPSNPTWPERDRVFWSAGHKAPALYVALGRAGYFPLDDVVFLRQLGSGFEGHPNCLKLPGVEELPLPSDGICAQCEFQSLELCAACRIEWGKVTRNFSYVCLACRAKPALR